MRKGSNPSLRLPNTRRKSQVHASESLLFLSSSTYDLLRCMDPLHSLACIKLCSVRLGWSIGRNLVHIRTITISLAIDGMVVESREMIWWHIVFVKWHLSPPLPTTQAVAKPQSQEFTFHSNDGTNSIALDQLYNGLLVFLRTPTWPTCMSPTLIGAV